MLVRKILETTLAAGSTSVSFTDSDIPNSLIRIYSNDPNLVPVTESISGTTVTVTYEAQTSSKAIALEIVKQGLEIVDNVTSEDTDKALSANQGKVLKDAIDQISDLSGLDDVDITEATDNDILIYDTDKWVNTPLPSIPSSLSDLNNVTITSPSDGQVLVYDDGTWINANNTSSNIDYSVNEQDTGIKWIDNKTIYQKTINIGHSFPIDYDVTSLGIDNCISLIANVGNWILPLLTPYANYNITVICSNNIIQARKGNDVGTINNDIYVTIRYTKSS